MSLMKNMDEKGENAVPLDELGNVPYYKTH